MVEVKKILIILSLIFLNIHAFENNPFEDESKEISVSFDWQGQNPFEDRKVMLVSSDGVRFPVLLSDVSESKLIKTTFESDLEATEFQVNIKAVNLEVLIKMLKIIHEYKDNFKKLENLYKWIQHIMQHCYAKGANLFHMFLISIYLDCDLVTNAIIYQLISFGFNINEEIVNPDHMSIFAKQSELRCKGSIDNFSEDVKNKIHITINDLLDYGCEIEIAYRFYNDYGHLDLTNLNLTGLDGIERIPDIEKVGEIDLSHNKIKNFAGFDREKFPNLKEVNLNFNLIKNIAGIVNTYNQYKTNIVVFVENNSISEDDMRRLIKLLEHLLRSPDINIEQPEQIDLLEEIEVAVPHFAPGAHFAPGMWVRRRGLCERILRMSCYLMCCCGCCNRCCRY